MSDKQKVLVTLTLLSETCLASITPLSQPPDPPSDHSTPDHPLAVLRKDFLSLLSLVYTSATKIALTLRPSNSEPAYTAALPVIKDYVTHISSLTTCATFFDEHGSTLAGEVRRFAKEVCEATRSLALTLTSTGPSNPSLSSSEVVSDGDYLVRTGAVHETVERIRKELSEDNLAALRKRWSADKEMLQDSLEDLNGMIEGAADTGEENEEDEGFGSDEDGYGLDELGLGAEKKLSNEELESVKKIQPLIRICVLLHKRILLDLLKSRNISVDLSTLDVLPPLSHQLLLATEEIIAVLYAPQTRTAVSAAVIALDGAVRSLQNALLAKGIIPPAREESLEAKMAAATIGEGASGTGNEPAKKEKDVRKWFETCFEQVHKLCNTIGGSLVHSEHKTT